MLAALESALEVAAARGRARRAAQSPWFAVPAVAMIVLPLLARRRWPFAAPAAVWLLAAAVSFVDGRLVGFTAGVAAAGLAAAFLLGKLPRRRQARIGLAVVLGGAAIVVSNDPNHAAGDFVFTPGGVRDRLARRLRAARARRAGRGGGGARAQAEREREAAARVAVAEERARIARELHDIVAHAVSVMVLQVGAVRHNLPDGPTTTARRCAASSETGRTALAEMRRLLGAMRRDDEDAELAPQPGLAAASTPLLDDVPPRRPAGAAARSTASRVRCRARSTSPPTGSSRRG